jgi:ATP-dependent RNA helicase DDX54/DBP10
MRARRDKITIKSDKSDKSETQKQPESSQEADAPISNLKSSFRDPEHYIAHFEPGNTAQERGYDVHQQNSFAEASRRVMMNLADDDGTSFAPARPKQRWDPKKKNFVNRANDDDGSGKTGKMIKGESGVKIPASRKSGR